MPSRDFDQWLSTFKTTIYGFPYYVNFPKIYDNVDSVRVQLNAMNSLIGSKHIEEDFDNLLKEYPGVIRCIPILIAKRLDEVKDNFEIIDDVEPISFDFTKISNSPEQYKLFMEKTGLFDLFANHMISSVYDYVMGVEVGLDSNARKNRGGTVMEDLVERHIQKSGFADGRHYFGSMNPGRFYFTQMYIHEIEARWKLDLREVSAKAKTEKRFDFVLKTPRWVYGVETNFYRSGGSKLNETARSYKEIAQEAEMTDGFRFVWITDGQGWNSARNNLRETFDEMELIFNLNDLEHGALAKLE